MLSPTTAPAPGSAFLLAGSLLLSGCSLLSKDHSADAAAAAVPSGPPSFSVEVEAPDAVRELLEKHLELVRFSQHPDLRRREVVSLLNASDSNIRDLIGTLGYFSPQIQLELKDTPDSKEAPMEVTVKVDPGPPTTIRTADIRFSGLNAEETHSDWQRDDIRKNWGLTPGEQFTQSAWGGAKSQGLRSLQAQRFPTASITSSKADIDADIQKADLSIDYAPGAAYYFGPLQLSYSTRTEDGEQDVDAPPRYDPEGMRRIARLPVGEEYKQTSLLDAQQRLSNSGYFDSVFLTLDTDAAQPGQSEVHAPVIAQVREAKLQKWVFGVGASTDTGPRLSVDHIHNRVPGLGWRAVSKLQLDTKNPILSTRLVDLPNEDGWAWFTGAKAEREELGDYNTNSLQLQFGRTKSADRIDRNYYLQYDFTKLQGTGAPTSSSSITANYGWTGRYFNNPISPTSGFGFAWEVGAGTTLTPEREPFGRVSARWLTLIGLGDPDQAGRRQSRLALRAAGGAVIAKDGVDIPATQLFLTGGDTTVRGYRYQSIGVENELGKLISGRYMVTGSVEWQRPITVRGNRSDWEQTVFVDAGSVADKPSQMTVYTGVGTGIRWASPVGPVQADIAYGIKTQQFRLHLRMGFTF